MKAIEDGEPLVDQLRSLAQRRPQDADRLFAIALQVEASIRAFRAYESPASLRALVSIYSRGIRVFEDVAEHPPAPSIRFSKKRPETTVRSFGIV